MSYFGVNIRKIRMVKKINQSEFGKLFGLTRAAIGSYEEGRAEAKIDKIIEIADYFGLTLDQLLKRKLSINNILHFDRKKNKNTAFLSFSLIPYIDFSRRKQYNENFHLNDFIDRLPKISIPDVEKNWRAFEIKDNREFLDNEIIICSPYDNKPNQNDWYLGLNKEGWDLMEKINFRKKYYQIWRIERVYVRSLYKLITNKLLIKLLNND